MKPISCSSGSLSSSSSARYVISTVRYSLFILKAQTCLDIRINSAVKVDSDLETGGPSARYHKRIVAGV